MWWDDVKTHKADAVQLPFPDESFHKAICSFALNIIPDYVQAIREVRRVLVPGGRFVAIEMRSGIHTLPRWLQPLPHICNEPIALSIVNVFASARGC
jgi:ubiquinone/menaquinone biosynthesis C-methylase UbiE